MYSRDANDATWYMLRYARDFDSRAAVLPRDPVPPLLDRRLFYDDDRAVLELLPKPSSHEVQPLPGFAVDVDGTVYRVDPDTGELLARRCDGSERPVTCEPQVFADPRGLALDRRGLLYVADPAARRVVVIDPEDGTVRAVLDGRLNEPVDVAVAPNGWIYVADRAAGRIVIFTARFNRRKSFSAKNSENLPTAPRPIAVMVDSAGNILVADAFHPRLLRFTPLGEPMADVPLSIAVAGSIPLPVDALQTIYGPAAPRFVAGTCGPDGPCAPPPITLEGAHRLAEVQLSIRLRRLVLGRSYESVGISLSAALDSGTLGTTWHRLELDADIPEGTRVTVETWTEDDRAQFLAGPSRWEVPRDPRNRSVPFTAKLPEQLIQSAPGRYLRARLTLESDGTATPSVRALKILFPRVSYLELLPRVYQRDPAPALFLEQFLALFERIFTRVEDRYERFSRELNLDAAPRPILDWLACLIDVTFDPSWATDRRRALVREAVQLYRRRGTLQGLRRYLEIYTGIDPVIIERFLERPGRTALVGRSGTTLGGAIPGAGGASSGAPEVELYRAFAHRFNVLVYLADRCDTDSVLPVVDRIIETNKPAHTVHTLTPVYPEARVGEQSTVGIDFVIGGRRPGQLRLGGCPPTRGPAREMAVLGTDAVLGDRRPVYLHEREAAL